MRVVWPYLVVLAAVAALFATFRPGDERSLPDVAPRAAPTLDAVEGLKVEASEGLPGWRAERAVPETLSGPIAIGGQIGAFRLSDVVVDLDGRLALRAETGIADGETLSLFRVRVSDGERRLLVAGEAALSGGRIRLPGLSAWFPGSADERLERDLSLDLAQLLMRLTAR